MTNQLALCRKRAGLTQKQLGAEIGVTYAAISNYETGKRQIEYETALKLGEILDCTVAEIYGQEELRPRSQESALERKYRLLDDHGKSVVDFVLNEEYKRCVLPPVVDLGTIRHYLSSPAAGVNGLTSEDYEDIPRTADMPKDADFCLTVSGDSMEPYIKDGEMVYVSEKTPLQELEVGVWCVDGATYVKQYGPGYGGELYLMSANPEREDANITIWPDGNRSVQYFGKVLLKKKLPRPKYK